MKLRIKNILFLGGKFLVLIQMKVFFLAFKLHWLKINVFSSKK